jgi:hypothetical protein
MRLAEIPQE